MSIAPAVLPAGTVKQIERAKETERILSILHQWGIHTLGQLAALPRDDLAARLGVRAVELWERANGRAERILKLVSPPESFIESFEFENEIETIEPLLFILRRFLHQLATRLNTIYLVAKELRLRITFADKSQYERIFKIPQPTNNEDILFRMLHTHLENFTSKDPIVAIELEAQPSRSVRQQFGLFETALRDPMQLHETLARLVGLLGADRVGTPVLEETHRPDAFRMEPFAWDFGHPEPEIGHPERSRGIPMRNLKGNIAGSLDCARDDHNWSMPYVELHANSAFSFLRGASFPEQLAQVAAELEMPALGLLDRHGVYGSQRFSVAAREQKVRPIIGAELTMEDGTVLPVLVVSRLGYANLCSLLSQAHLRSNVKGECAVKWEELPEFAQGLVAFFGSGSAGCQPAASGSLPDANSPRAGRFVPGLRQAAANSRLAACAPQTAEDRTQLLIDTFGRENAYVEIQRHFLRGEDRINRALVDLASKFRLALIATNGVQYAKPSGRQVLDVFTCIREHTHLDLAGKLLTQNAERHLKSDAEMCAIFRDLLDAITNTERLAERLEFSLENIGYEFPEYAVPDGHTMNSFLRTMVLFGAQQRYESITKKVKRQLEEELSLITRLGFAGYFLIVWDIINFCRENNIMVQGRGSAANSAVCFCLGITPVDPVSNHLVFERFLNESRKGWPDIDLDLPSGDRRERVIQEVYRRYGKHGAAMTANVITYRGRSAAREIGKALNFSPSTLDRFSHLFAHGDFPHTLELEAQIEQAALPKAHPRMPAFVGLYQAIHGLPRHLVQHSGGMIIR